MKYLFVFNGKKKKCSTNAPQCYVYTYIACLVLQMALRTLQRSSCICCGNTRYFLLNNFFMVLAKQFHVTAWYAKHSHFSRKLSFHRTAFFRQNATAWLEIAVCVSHSVWNTKHDTSNTVLRSLFLGIRQNLPFRNVAKVHGHFGVVNCLRSQHENNTTTMPWKVARGSQTSSFCRT
jgi:hypothetical protein